MAKIQTDSVSGKTLVQLRETAKELGLKSIAKLKKSELEELILATLAEKSKNEAPKKTTRKKSAAAESSTEKQADTNEKKKTARTKPAAEKKNAKPTRSGSAAGRRAAPAKENADTDTAVTENLSEKADSAEKTEKKTAHTSAKTAEDKASPSKSDDNSQQHTAADAPQHRQNVERPNGEKEKAPQNGNTTDVMGILDVHADGFGFLRGENYLTTPNDVYVSPTQIRRFNLKTGDCIFGIARKANEGERFDALIYVKTVNGDTIDKTLRRRPFEYLTPIYPDERLRLEYPGCDFSVRLIDLFAPIGKGQRGMIVAPPKTGKTTLLKNVAKSISETNPDVNLIVLLVDERPEEVTDMKRSIKGEVIYSTFDELPEHHIKVAEMVLERAMRLVEHGKDVVILLDSITRLTRAYNLTIPPTGRTLSGGIDPGALHKPKKFFGAARNIENGGSLTILATALVETGSRMDDVIFEEFKGTGNMEIHLDRRLSEKRIFPAIDIYKSGTRKDDLIMNKEEREAAWAIRHSNNSGGQDLTEKIIHNIRRTSSNEEFINSMIIKRVPPKNGTPNK